MASLAWIPVFLILHGGHSYILLTANLDDVQAIAKEMASSPVAGQLTKILRRASNVFNHQLRASSVGNEERSFRSQPQVSDSSFEPLQDNRIERRNGLNKKHHHNHKRSRTNDDQMNHHSYRRIVDSQNRTESYNEDDTPNHDPKTHESREKMDTSNSEEQESHRDNIRGNKDEAKKDSDQEKVIQPSKELEGTPKESDRSKERDEDDIKVERHEKRADSQSHSDEIVALGKNASVYLNSIKKIMEAI